MRELQFAWKQVIHLFFMFGLMVHSIKKILPYLSDQKQHNLGLVSLCALHTSPLYVLFLNPMGWNHLKFTRKAVTGCLVAVA